MNSLGKISSLVFALFVFFILPVAYYARQQDALLQIFVQNETRKFSDAVRDSGYLDEAMYLSFLSALDSTGNLYQVTMDHAHQWTEPQLDETGAVTGYDEYGISSYENEILIRILEQKRTYFMSQEDYFSVKVTMRSDTYYDFWERIFYGTTTSEGGITATAGGRILDEWQGEEK